MGVPHLERIEVFLKKSKVPLSITAIWKGLGINRLVVAEALDYLRVKKLVRVKEGKYSWRKK